ncbi:MAG: hypothetical protein H7844_03880 [Nitrospirae bacterium YQR-1]
MTLKSHRRKIEDYLPHRDAMLLIDELLYVQTDTGGASVVIKEDNIFYASDEGLNPAAYVELIAQTAAAYTGYDDRQKNKPVRSGFLTGVKDFQVTAESRAGDTLCIDIMRSLDMKNATVLEGLIKHSDGRVCAKGTLTLWILDQPLEPPVLSGQSPFSDVTGKREALLDELKGGGSRVENYIFEHTLINVRGKDTLVMCIPFNSGFMGFAGHFPQAPVLPGVVVLQSALAAAEILTDKHLRLETIEKAKFMGVVLPEQPLICECKVTDKGEQKMCNAAFTVNNRKVASALFSVREA